MSVYPNPVVSIQETTPDGFAEITLEMYGKLVATSVFCNSDGWDGVEKFSRWLESELAKWKNENKSLIQSLVWLRKQIPQSRPRPT